MKKMLGVFVLAAFLAATLAVGMAVAKSSTGSGDISKMARMKYDNGLFDKNMVKSHLKNMRDYGSRHCMDLRPVDKRAMKLYSVEKVKELAKDGIF
jgi:hypothetical protein